MLPSGLQLKSVSGTVEAWTGTMAETGPLPTFDTIAATGNVVAEEVVTLRTMAVPCEAPAGVTVRSLVIPALKTSSLGSDTRPYWSSSPVVGAISYQATASPAPPATVWATQ